MRGPPIYHSRAMGSSQATHTSRGIVSPALTQPGGYCTHCCSCYHAQGSAHHHLQPEPSARRKSGALSRLRGFCHTEPSTLAGALEVRSSLTPATLRPSALSGSGDRTFHLVSDMPGCATHQATTRPGRRPTTDMVTGSIHCQADGRPHSSTLS